LVAEQVAAFCRSRVMFTSAHSRSVMARMCRKRGGGLRCNGIDDQRGVTQDQWLLPVLAVRRWDESRGFVRKGS
jgi:hypothetical protein